MSKVDKHSKWSTKYLINFLIFNRLIFLLKKKLLDFEGVLHLIVNHQHIIYFSFLLKSCLDEYIIFSGSHACKYKLHQLFQLLTYNYVPVWFRILHCQTHVQVVKTCFRKLQTCLGFISKSNSSV
jgi:hypothetical protein